MNSYLYRDSEEQPLSLMTRHKPCCRAPVHHQWQRWRCKLVPLSPWRRPYPPCTPCATYAVRNINLQISHRPGPPLLLMLQSLAPSLQSHSAPPTTPKQRPLAMPWRRRSAAAAPQGCACRPHRSPSTSPGRTFGAASPPPTPSQRGSSLWLWLPVFGCGQEQAQGCSCKLVCLFGADRGSLDGCVHMLGPVHCLGSPVRCGVQSSVHLHQQAAAVGSRGAFGPVAPCRDLMSPAVCRGPVRKRPLLLPQYSAHPHAPSDPCQ